MDQPYRQSDQKRKYMLKNVWQKDEQGDLLIIASQTINAFNINLEIKKFTDNFYSDALSHKDNHGGQGDVNGKSKSDLHLARYFNSASRTQMLAIPDCHTKFDLERKLIIKHFMGGKVNIIDIAAGHGAGTMSLINSIALFREHGLAAAIPLNIEIHALEFCERALSHYSTIVESEKDYLNVLGINIEINEEVIDLLDTKAFSEKIKEINCKKNGEMFFIICSAITGIGKDLFEEEFKEVFDYLVKSFHSKNSVFLWVEPRNKIAPEYWGKLNEDYMSAMTEHDTKDPINYRWLDPITKDLAKSYLHYFLVELA